FTAPLATTLAPGETTTFTVSFAPLGAGSRQADLMISSSDYDELPFDVLLYGTGFIPLDNFTPTLDNVIYATAIQPDGKVLAGGSFTSVDGENAGRVARFLEDGSLDPTFSAWVEDGSSVRVFAIVVQPNGKILIGGEFRTVNGVQRVGIARLHPDGSLDTSFDPHPGSNVNFYTYAIALQPDGKIYCISDVSGGSRLVRLNPDGTRDLGFNSTITNYSAIALQSDGRILVAQSSPTALLRLETDGTLDGSFVPNASLVETITVQADGKILIGGTFTTVGGVTRNRIARLESTGALDAGFDPDSSSSVHTITLQANGKILVGGSFTTIGGLTRNRLAKFDPDGTIDPSFDPNAGSSVRSLSIQEDGRVIVGGWFAGIAGTQQRYLARVPNNEVAGTNLTVTGTSQMDWTRSGATADLQRVRFESWNGSGWDDLGPATRPGGSWQLSGLSLPAAGWVRASGASPGGYGGGSAGRHVAVTAYGSPPALAPDIRVEVDGMAVVSGPDTTVSFAQQDWLTGSAPRTVTLTNDGTVDLTGLALGLSGVDGDDFSFTALSVATLAPGASTSFELVFRPRGGGARAGLLSIASNDPNEAPFEVELRGAGMHRDPDYYPSFTGGNNIPVATTIVEPDGGFYVGGEFDRIDGNYGQPNRLARFDAAGNLDSSYTPAASNLYAVAATLEGKIVAGGGGTWLRRFLA
ncbi:MAG: choice-of-anchor D domain-containing protein, partial [Verrucomicrobiales bacterium]